MKRYSVLIFLLLMHLTSCSLFEDDDNELDIRGDLYLKTIFQGVIYDEEGSLMLNGEVRIDLFREKEGEVKSRALTYTDDFGSFTAVFSLGTTREDWYYRLYVKPPRQMEPLLASEGPVELGSLNTLEINLGD